MHTFNPEMHERPLPGMVILWFLYCITDMTTRVSFMVGINQCEATQEWIVQMNVHNLPNRQFQPFYNVLVEDGSNRYAAEGVF